MRRTHQSAHHPLARAVGLVFGVVADQIFGDPPNHRHPVAWFGSWVNAVEKRLYADRRDAGVLFAAASTIPIVATAFAAERASRRHPILQCLATAITTWAVVGARSLYDEGHLMAQFLEDGDLDKAREQLSHLCSRDADVLDETELARATVESMAENTSDATVGSLVWGALFGIPGMATHRCLNTLDAMVGHHNKRYENFGWASAKADDLANLIPARLTGALTCALAHTVGGQPRQAWKVMCRDGAKHPSPNGGWCESAFAGALGVQLGGRNVYYNGRVEERGLLGDGPRPDSAQVHRAAHLVEYVSYAAAIAIAALAASAAIGRKR